MEHPTMKKTILTHLLFFISCSYLFMSLIYVFLSTLPLVVADWAQTMLVVSRNLLNHLVCGLSLSLWIFLLFVLLIPVLVFCVYQLQDIFRKSGPQDIFGCVGSPEIGIIWLSGETHLAALRLDNYHSLRFTLSSPLFCFGFPQF